MDTHPPTAVQPLPPLIARHLDAVVALCREFGVERLEVFGSVVTDAFDPVLSDIDFLVTYPRGQDLGPWMKRHFELREHLVDLFRRRIDLVMATEFRNPYFAESVNATRQTLYAI